MHRIGLALNFSHRDHAGLQDIQGIGPSEIRGPPCSCKFFKDAKHV
jgi:hypothetical protein